MTGEEAQLAELRRQFPAWEIWFVPSAVRKAGTWCANPWAKKDDRRNVLHADTAEHLAEYIAEYTEPDRDHVSDRGHGRLPGPST